MADFPCVCGHSKFDHEFLRDLTGNVLDTDESWCATDLDLNCVCVKYVPSNLKYLEQKYKEKGKK